MTDPLPYGLRTRLAMIETPEQSGLDVTGLDSAWAAAAFAAMEQRNTAATLDLGPQR